MNDRFTPRHQADCDHANAARDYDRTHKVWMNTSVFTEQGAQAKIALGDAREKYIAAVKAAHPTWSVM